MDRIRRFLYSKHSKYIISIILGIGLSSLFRKVCNDRSCMIFKGPPIDKINNQIFKYNDKCYKYSHKITDCDMNKKIINFA